MVANVLMGLLWCYYVVAEANMVFVRMLKVLVRVLLCCY